MTPKNQLSEVRQISPEELTVHPALEDFPGLSDDQLAALTISVKERGIQTPLICDEENQVYDGRALLGIAKALELESVPVIVRPEADVVAFAIESAVNRRQLTKSGIAFLLFEQHPELAATRGSRQGGRPKKTDTIVSVSGKALADRHETFRQMGARYRVPQPYFSNLAEMKEGSSEEEWDELRRLVLYEEASIPRQFAGFCTTQKPGVKRGAVIYGWVNEQGILEGIIPRSFASIRQGFSMWGDAIDSRAKHEIEKQWAELLDAAPPELRKIAKRKAAL